MRSKAKFSICASEVHAVTTDWIQQHLKLQDYSKKCLSSMMLSVLLFAASRIRSVHDACQRLRRLGKLRGGHFARPTPFSPEIHQHRNRCVVYYLIKL